MKRGEVVLLDVRPEAEYQAGHEGARSIPLDELERRLAELPQDAEIVAYCRGPFCAYAHDAVRRRGGAQPGCRCPSPFRPRDRCRTSPQDFYGGVDGAFRSVVGWCPP